MHIKNVKEITPYPLRDRLINQYLFSPIEANEIWDFLQCMLKYNPSERKTASEMLTHKWIN